MASQKYFGLCSLLVREYDEAIDYYCQVLGFELIEDIKLNDQKRWVVVAPNKYSRQKSGAAILLARAANDEQSVFIGNQTGGRVGFFLFTDNFESEYNLLRSKGVKFLETPREERYGKVVVFQDLYGNKWDLLESI
jgi:uncharacterized glyoxalase superfamily protein PhnB